MGFFLSTKLASLQPPKNSKARAAGKLGPGTRTAHWLSQRAAKQARHYQYLEAGKTYGAYLQTIALTDLSGRGSALLRISFLRYRAALQANTAKSFRAEISASLVTLKEAEDCFEKLGKQAAPDLYRDKAFEAYLDYWITKNPAERRKLLEKSWSLAKKAFHGYSASKRDLEYAATFDELSPTVGILLEVDWRLASREKNCREAVEHGKRTIQVLRLARKKAELTRALVRTALFLDSLSEITLEGAKAPKFQQEALTLWKEAQKTSKEIAYEETSRPPQGFHRILDQNQSLEIYKETLRIMEPQHDKFANGWLTEKLAKWSFYAAEAREDPALRVKGHVEALHYAEEAGKNFEIINYTSAGGGVLWVHSPHAEHFYQLATYQSDPIRRRLLQEKSLESTPELLKLARESGHPQVVAYAFHIGAKSAVTLAEIEPNKRRKIRLLKDGLQRRVGAVRVIRKIEPVSSWNRGIMLKYLADTQAKLAELADGPAQQQALLEEAELSQEEGLRIATEHHQSMERAATHVFRGPIGRYHFEHATVLQRLFSITGDQEYLRKAAKEYSAAADWFQTAGRPSGAAESYWKSAETYDSLQAHSLASENFLLGSKAYESLGKTTSPLKDFAQDYARYLHAWSKIEQARSLHQEFRYDSAALAYRQASQLHRSTKRWRFLAPYYMAWSSLESGENLSRNGRRKKAITAFERASSLFGESTASLKNRLTSLDQPDEKKMVSILAETPKMEYCQARTILEKATLAESREEYQTSFEKFGLASDRLREVAERSELRADRDETSFLSTLCRAWQLSSKAELDNSADSLQEAAAEFGRAKAKSPSQNAAKLAQGHEEFSKALVSSRRFAETLDPVVHREASTYLDHASNLYLESGFKTAADHALGRKLLLDAFAQLNQANNELDPKKKASLYLVTISLLRESGIAFRKARQPRKVVQARELLRKAKIESRIASQLTDIMEAALETPTNIVFHPPTQGNEKPVGLDRFDRADIEIQLSNVTKGLRHEDVELEFAITNTGKQPVTLVRIDEALPDGTEIGKPLEQWRLQGKSIVPLQKHGINILQTTTLKVPLRIKTEGLLEITPRVVFADQAEIENERALETRVIPTSPIVEFLANAFVKDYVSKRLALSASGWRTLMEVVHDLKIPRSHVYGEPRYGRMFGRQLDTLVRSSLVEYRIFPGERGRGGDITKVRVQLTNRELRGYLGEQVPDLGIADPLSEEKIPATTEKMAVQILSTS